MARIRTVKPEIWTDEKFVELSPFARLFFIGLFNFADDEGRMEFSEKRLKMQIFPADNLEVAPICAELRRIALINIYSFENKEFLQISGFEKHQKIDKRRPSKYPPAPDCGEKSLGREWKGREGKGYKTANAGYAFTGKIIKLSAEHLEEWRNSYSAIPDILAQLKSLDVYYDGNLEGAERGNWFIRCSTALAKKHQEFTAKAVPKKTGITPMHVGAGG